VLARDISWRLGFIGRWKCGWAPLTGADPSVGFGASAEPILHQSSFGKQAGTGFAHLHAYQMNCLSAQIVHLDSVR
jgi:hypothetical protein